jgi:predicted esterase
MFMKTRLNRFSLIVLGLAVYSFSDIPAANEASADEFVDNFSEANFEGRSAERGEWKFENNVASCVADPDLYLQYKNHGPILKWSREFRDATIVFEMKASRCQRVVFTLNGDGHVFRVTLADETPDATAGPSKVPTRLIGWATKSSKQNKGDTIKPDGLPDLPAVDGKWVKVKLAVAGNQGELTIGDFKTKIEHSSLAREKNMVMLTFAHGELAVRDFRFSTIAGMDANESTLAMSAPVDGHKLRYLLQTSSGDRPKNGWPLLLFLHGYGECGDEIELVKKHGPPKLQGQFAELANSVIVSPQCPRDSWWRVEALKQLVDEVVENCGDIDPARLYVTGLSMGGYGTWSLVSQYPDFFAAAVPICGGGDPLRLPKNRPPVKQGIRNEFEPDGLKRANDLPIWTFHGTADQSVPILETGRLVDLLKKSGSRVQFTIYDDAGHVESWQKAYGNAEVWKWLFSQSKVKANSR